MAYAYVASQLTIDNAHADGLVQVKGIGRDWSAVESRDDQLTFTPDVRMQHGWQYNNEFEYIDRLSGIAPLARFTQENEAIAKWTINKGLWRNTSIAGSLKYQYLHFYDARPNRVAANAYGVATSKGNFAPNILVWLWRYASDPAETDVAQFGIYFQGDGIIPEYAVVLPAFAAQDSYAQEQFRASGYYTKPFLAGRPQGESQWAEIDKIEAGAAPGYAGAEQGIFQWIKIEYLAETIIIRIDDEDRTWTFGGEWESQAGAKVNFSMVNGPLQIRVIGHTAAACIAQLGYPSLAYLRPRAGFYVPDDYNQTPAYRVISDLQGGCSLVTSADEGTPANWSRPKVEFASTDTNHRAIVYCVQEYRTATIGGAAPNPVTTQDSPSLKLISARGRMDESWKGAEVTAMLEAKQGSTLVVIKPNSKVSVQVSTDDGVTFWEQFTGYTLGPERTMPAGGGAATATLTARDIVEARLSHKMMDWHCSYEAWPENEAVEHILNRAGVPEALINVDPSLTGDLPSSSTKGSEKLKFQPDIDVVAALTMIAEVRDREWGVGCDGVIFWRDREEHESGYYDWTLDADTVSLEQVAGSIHSQQSIADFANFLRVMVGEGVDATAKVQVDEPSISDPTDRAFIGDIWQRVEMRPDGDNAQDVIDALWPQFNQLSDIIRWEMWDEPWLAPGHYVRVQATDADIPMNSIYKIIAKDWSAEENGRYHQELEAKMVEKGPEE